ncbi:MAG TPA: hypothetical protein VFB10_02035 [Candidatus Dormibacteraeota bacterium]|nr:hypothetical protein [Candidatus Dormibacteraeota bacterium]
MPDLVVHFFDAHGLASKDLTEIDFLAAQTHAPAVGHYDSLVVEGIVAAGQSGSPCRRAELSV